ncbi:MAG: Ribosomal RNA large subunit methyltransferase K/L [Phycisphaerae bacterium]|nr:Ribosomal RNA large subunit methyltransferase K/L [Phycisphaerae bacterium]
MISRRTRSRRAVGQNAAQPAAAAPRAAHSIRSRIDAAIRRRAHLLADFDCTACRVVNGAADDLPGLIIERFGPVLIAQLHAERLAMSESEARDACAYAADALRASSVYRKWYPPHRGTITPQQRAAMSAAEPWIGVAAAPNVTIVENGVRLVARPYDGLLAGVFLDQRDNRRRVAQRAAGRRVLNLFSYTCSFSAVAAVGGAAATTSVDVSRKALAWGRENFAANGLELTAHSFLGDDARDFVRRAGRRERRYDLVIVDPPTFARAAGAGRVWMLQRDLPHLLADVLAVCERGALVLLSANQRTLEPRWLERALRAAGAGRRVEAVERPELPADFAGDDDLSRSIWARID